MRVGTRTKAQQRLWLSFFAPIMNTSHHPGGAPDVFQKLVTAVNEKREYTEANERVADSWRKSNRRHHQLEMEGLE